MRLVVQGLVRRRRRRFLLLQTRSLGLGREPRPLLRRRDEEGLLLSSSSRYHHCRGDRPIRLLLVMAMGMVVITP